MSGLGQVLSGKVNLPINAHQTVVLKYAVSDILRGRAGFQIWNTRFQPSALIYSSHWDRNKCLIMMNAIWMLLLTGTLVGTISAGLLGVYMLRPYKFFNVIEVSQDLVTRAEAKPNLNVGVSIYIRCLSLVFLVQKLINIRTTQPSGVLLCMD